MSGFRSVAPAFLCVVFTALACRGEEARYTPTIDELIVAEAAARATWPAEEPGVDLSGYTWKGVGRLDEWVQAVATNRGLKTVARYRDESLIPFIVRELKAPASTNAAAARTCPEARALMEEFGFHMWKYGFSVFVGPSFGNDTAPADKPRREILEHAASLRRDGCSLDPSGCRHPFVRLLAAHDYLKWNDPESVRKIGRAELEAILSELPGTDDTLFFRILVDDVASRWIDGRERRDACIADRDNALRRWIVSRMRNAGNVRPVLDVVAHDWANADRSLRPLLATNAPAGLDPWFAERFAAADAYAAANHMEAHIWAHGRGMTTNELERAVAAIRENRAKQLRHFLNCHEIHPEIPETIAEILNVAYADPEVLSQRERWLAKGLEAELDNPAVWRACMEIHDEYSRELRQACLRTKRFDTRLPLVYVSDTLEGAPRKDAAEFHSYFSRPNRRSNLVGVVREMVENRVLTGYDEFQMRNLLPIVCHLNGDYDDAEAWWRHFHLALDWNDLPASVSLWSDFPDKEATLVALDLLSDCTNAAVFAVEGFRASGKTNEMLKAAQALLADDTASLSSRETCYLLRLVNPFEVRDGLAHGEWISCPFTVCGAAPYWPRVNLPVPKNKFRPEYEGEGTNAWCNGFARKEAAYYLDLPEDFEVAARLTPFRAAYRPNPRSVFKLVFGKYVKTRRGADSMAVSFNPGYVGVGLDFSAETNDLRVMVGHLANGRDKVGEDEFDAASLTRDMAQPIDLHVQMSGGTVSVFIGQEGDNPVIVRENLFDGLRKDGNKIGILGDYFNVGDIRYRALMPHSQDR